ncbi:MAG: hypothetical protein MJZ86_00840 [Bacteroidales bacterium]|nr:hypothetical protein [Bacteroidales bacterium]
MGTIIIAWRRAEKVWGAGCGNEQGHWRHDGEAPFFFAIQNNFSKFALGCGQWQRPGIAAQPIKDMRIIEHSAERQQA